MANQDSNPLPATPRDRTTLALLGVVALFGVLDIAGTWIAPFLNYGDNYHRYLEFLAAGVMIFQPIMFGIWTALGPGPLVNRLVVMFPLLALLCVMPGYVPAAYKDVELRDFLVIVAAAFGVCLLTLGVFLLIRRFARLRLTSAATPDQSEARPLNFSIKQLLVLVTIYAIALGFATGLNLRHSPPPPPNTMFGPNFLIMILTIFGAIGFVVAVPTTVAGLAILFGALRRKALRAIAVWFVATATITAVSSNNNAGEAVETIFMLSLVSLGALAAGIIAAIPLRLAGWRLTRLPAGNRDAIADSESATT